LFFSAELQLDMLEVAPDCSIVAMLMLVLVNWCCMCELSWWEVLVVCQLSWISV